MSGSGTRLQNPAYYTKNTTLQDNQSDSSKPLAKDQQIEQLLQVQSHMNPHRTSEDDFFPEISQVQDADYHTGSEHFLEDIEAEFQQFPPQSLEEFEGHEDDDDDDFLESQFAQDSMNQRKTPSNLDISEEDFQNSIWWTWWDMLRVRRQTQMMMMMAKASGVSRAGNFLRKKKQDPTKHPQRIAAGLISSTLIRKLYLMFHPTTLN